MKFSLPSGLLFVVLARVILGCADPAPDERALYSPLSSIAALADKPFPATVEVIVSKPSITAIAVRGDVAHAAGMGRIWALHTGSLEPIAVVDTPGSAADIVLWEDKLIVADGPAGLTQYTLDAAGKPIFTKPLAPHEHCFRVVASTRGIAGLCRRRKLVFVTPGHDPKVISLPVEPVDAAFMASSLFLAGSGDGLLRMDLDSNNPQVLFDHEKLDRIMSLAVVHNRLFVGLRDKRVLELEPETGAVKSEVPILNRPMRLVGGKNHLLVASTWLGDTGATLVDTSDATQLRVGARLPFSVATAAFVETSQWLVARPEGGVSAVSFAGEVLEQMDGVRFERIAMAERQGLSWAENRSAVWMFDKAGGNAAFFPWNVVDAAECGDGLCVLETTGRLCRYRLAETTPECIEVAEGGASLGEQPNQKRIWVFDANGGLHGLTLEPGLKNVAALPRVPTIAAQNLGRMAIDGDRGVVVDVDTGVLQVVDVGPTPQWRGRFLLHARPTAIAVATDAVFVVEPRGGIQVISLSQPDTPREIAWHPLDGAVGIAAKRDESGKTFVLVAEGGRGLSVWVWQSELRRLEKIRRITISGAAFDVVVRGSEVFVAAGGNILQLSFSELVR